MSCQDVFSFQKEDLHLSAFPIMEDIRRQGKLCDVTLKVGDQRFSAHRIVLAACIPYFNAMFTHDMVESNKPEIIMQGIDSSALESLINFAYNGKICLTTSNVQSILVGASYLNLTCVKEVCCNFITERLHPNTVFGVRQFAEAFMCHGLVQHCTRYIHNHCALVLRSEEFLSIKSDELEEILSSDELIISEKQIFEALIRWIRHDLELRLSSLPALLAHVRLPLLSPVYISDVVAKEELIKNSFQCRDLVDEAKDYHLLPERRGKINSTKLRPRFSADIVGTIFAVGGLTSLGQSMSTVECFDPRTEEWKDTPPMKLLRSRVGIAVLKGKMYAIGGYNGQRRLNTVEVYDPSTEKWEMVAPMNRERSALGAVSLGEKLYVCGGYDGVASLCSVECYDPSNNTWSMTSQMTTHRSAAGVAVFEGKIYALGGHDGLSIFDSVEFFDNSSASWAQTTPMLIKRCRLGVSSLEHRLYVCGGYDGTSFLRNLEVYDAGADQWTLLAPMSIKRSRVALVTNKGRLYAIGGYDGQANLNTVEVYDARSDTWSKAPPMRAHEGGVGVGIIPLDPEL